MRWRNHLHSYLCSIIMSLSIKSILFSKKTRLIWSFSSTMLIIVLSISLLSTISFISIFPFVDSSEQDVDLKNDLSGIRSQPMITNEPNLKIEIVSKLNIEYEKGSRLFSPVSSMAFLDVNDILVLDKNNGKIYRILNGTMLEEVLLDVSVANKIERGMLGIAISKNKDVTTTTSNTTTTTMTTRTATSNQNESNTTYVFLYFTESEKEDGNDNCPNTNTCLEGNEPVGNRLYRYELINNKLVNPKLLLDLPATPGLAHNGGAIMIGLDNHLYVPIGDVRGSDPQEEETTPDGRSGILRVTQDGQAVLTKGKGIIGDEDPLNKYYAYGIRNSFGIDFDPVSGILWDTENGRGFGDEINLVKPGFNSGWSEIQGMWKNDGSYSEPGDIALEEEIEEDEGNDYDLVDFGGKGKYSTPEFSWYTAVGPTAIKFLDSDRLGKQYQNDMFVGDFNNGNIYHFDLNKERTKLILNGTLEDTIVDTSDELQNIIFAQGFGGITDMEVGPDGYLYILSFYEGQGTIFRIVPDY
jgi:aldose sugar dehydrogenase